MIPEEFPDSRICIVGLGYVGLTLAVEMAAVGFQVHGVDVRDDIIGGLEKGEPHFWEEGLTERLRLVISQRRFTFSKRMPATMDHSVFIITVGTPLGPDGHARLDMIENATREIASVMREGALVILRSTVRIGTARRNVQPILAATGRRFELAVCPERTLEGRALTELREIPQVIGADASRTAHRAAQIFGCLTPTTLRVVKLETAEIVKLVDNTYRDVMFAFGNEVARICDAVGVSAHEVISAGKLGYPRTNVALPGPVGGPCLEKDGHILRESCKLYGIDVEITTATRMINERLPRESAAFLRKVFTEHLSAPRDMQIALLGIAFKGQPATDDLRGTMARPILQALQQEFPQARFRAYDAVVAPAASASFLGIEAVDTLEQAFSGASLVCILNNHSALRGMALSSLSREMTSPGIVYDFWNLFAGKNVQLKPAVRYVSLGSHSFAYQP